MQVRKCKNAHSFSSLLVYIQQFIKLYFVLISHSEKTKSLFEGTIIDIETIGEFCYDYDDSRHYQNLTPTIVGYINKDGLNIFCAGGMNAIEELIGKITHTLPYLERPLFAFNCCFEKGVLFHSCGTNIRFKGELNKEKYESKKNAIAILQIPNYGDPFNNIGFECLKAWKKGHYRRAIKHNRSCLLKERDILLKRGYRKPEELILYSH